MMFRCGASLTLAASSTARAMSPIETPSFPALPGVITQTGSQLAAMAAPDGDQLGYGRRKQTPGHAVQPEPTSQFSARRICAADNHLPVHHDQGQCASPFSVNAARTISVSAMRRGSAPGLNRFDIHALVGEPFQVSSELDKLRIDVRSRRRRSNSTSVGRILGSFSWLSGLFQARG